MIFQILKLESFFLFLLFLTVWYTYIINNDKVKEICILHNKEQIVFFFISNTLFE